MPKKASRIRLLRDLRRWYKAHGRSHLPWRNTRDAYKILVSEMMLQQTQVDRVVPYYAAFIKKFPSARVLARAPLSQVLRVWQGLGYNRRAKYLHEAAKVLSSAKIPFEKVLGSPVSRSARARARLFSQGISAAPQLPGVGPYTRGAVLAFAFNKPEVFVETNIRTVLLHHLKNSMIYHRENKTVADAQLLPVVAQLLRESRMEPREFYAAMMDYGAHLKAQGVRLNARSAHYAKQSKFEGSARQLRGAIVRELLKKPQTLPQLIKNLSPRGQEEIERELGRLMREGMATRLGRHYRIAR